MKDTGGSCGMAGGETRWCQSWLAVEGVSGVLTERNTREGRWDERRKRVRNNDILSQKETRMHAFSIIWTNGQ